MAKEERKLQTKPFIALEKRLKGCTNVRTLGVNPDFSDYTEEERLWIHQAPKIYYPSTLYAGLFNTLGKPIFPSFQTYYYAQDKIRQTALFQLLGIPHPPTRVYYGQRNQKRITEHFSFPFIGKIPRGSSMGRGVYLIRTMEDLKAYLGKTRVAYIQDYLPVDRDLRVVIIGPKVALAYWRISRRDEFRTNVALGGEITFSDIPGKACDLALSTAIACGWNDVGIDILVHGGCYYVIEANMKYGKAGFQAAGLDYHRLMEELLEKGDV